MRMPKVYYGKNEIFDSWVIGIDHLHINRLLLKSQAPESSLQSVQRGLAASGVASLHTTLKLRVARESISSTR